MKTEMAKISVQNERTRYNIKFPPTEPHTLEQNEARFSIEENGEEKFFRFHDYDELYKRPGLYEQLFYERLKCISPMKIVSMLKNSLQELNEPFGELRVLDFGAGNGIVGEELRKIGVARVVGVDISSAAHLAAERDRPSVYDAYYVSDLRRLENNQVTEIKNWQCNCLASVAALGFNDIPTQAFANVFNLMENGSWIAFNIKDDFLDENDQTGFSTLIKQMILQDYLKLCHLEGYGHRTSIDGKALYYYAIIGRKKRNFTQNVL